MVDGANLRFGAIAMTRMACPDRMEVETVYAAVFDATRSWRVNEGMLELLAGDRVLARFRR
jgi:heat shock protein HslJ